MSKSLPKGGRRWRIVYHPYCEVGMLSPDNCSPHRRLSTPSDRGEDGLISSDVQILVEFFDR